MISVEKLKILTPFQKLPKNVGDLGKLIIVKGLKSCPKCNKLPNLVTPATTHYHYWVLVAVIVILNWGFNYFLNMGHWALIVTKRG